jgi:hypothetical protein
MGEVNAVFGTEVVKYNGSEYKLPRPTLETECIFETWLEDIALDKIQRRRFKMGEDTYRTALSIWEKDCAAGEYSWGSPTSEKATRNPNHGFKQLIMLMMRQEDQSVTMEVVQKIVETDLDQLVTKFNKVMSETPTIPPSNSGANS